MPKRHVIQQGESVVSLSERYGLFVETIWQHADNADLKKKRKDMNVLFPGDVLVIPDKQPKELPGETGKRHTFRRKGIPAIFRLQVFDFEEPRANQDYQLTVDGRTYLGTTDEEGILIEYLPARARRGELRIGPDDFRVALEFGEMDPIDELSGVQKRLRNLGYACGAPDGRPSAATRAALAAFQRRFGLPETGEPDKDTLAKLETIHDMPSEFPGEKPPGAG
jgi:hypothetical protein